MIRTGRILLVLTVGFLLINTLVLPIRPASSQSLSPWGSTTAYPIVAGEDSCAVYSGYIYCVGGYVPGSGASNAVYYAPLSPSGIGTWTNTSAYPIRVLVDSCATSSGYIYCVGGYDGAAMVNAVYFAPVSASGVGVWTNTSAYPTSIGISFISCATSSGYIYCVGGYNGTHVTNGVNYAPVSASGVGAWASAAGYPTAINHASCGASSGYIFCVGGNSGSGYGSAAYYSGIVPPSITTTSTQTSSTTTSHSTTSTSTTSTTASSTTATSSSKTTSTSSATTASSTTSSGGGSGIPEFPTQLGFTLLVTVAIIASYVLARRLALPRSWSARFSFVMPIHRKGE